MYSDNIARFKDSSNHDCMDCHDLDSKTNVHKSNQKEIKEKVLELKEELNKLLDEYSYINFDGVSFNGVSVQYLKTASIISLKKPIKIIGKAIDHKFCTIYFFNFLRH